MSLEMERCPFCGGEEIMLVHITGDDNSWYAVCSDEWDNSNCCGARTDEDACFSQIEAKAAWNRRT